MDVGRLGMSMVYYNRDLAESYGTLLRTVRFRVQRSISGFTVRSHRSPFNLYAVGHPPAYELYGAVEAK